MGELFLASSRTAESSCSLQAAVREDELDSSELFFVGFGSSGQQAAGAVAAMQVGAGVSGILASKVGLGKERAQAQAPAGGLGGCASCCLFFLRVRVPQGSCPLVVS